MRRAQLKLFVRAMTSHHNSVAEDDIRAKARHIVAAFEDMEHETQEDPCSEVQIHYRFE
jgi:hypothetical protein